MRLQNTVAGVAFLLLAGCGSPSEQSPQEARESNGGTVVVSNLADIDTPNDLISSGSSLVRDVERLLFLQLARELPGFEDGLPTYEPQLAERWEFSEDGRALTFFLRDARWSDGEPITAQDVVWTHEAQTHPEIAWRSARRKESIERVEAVNARTVRFHFSESYPQQLMDANRGAVLPRHAWAELPFSEWRSNAAWFSDRMIGSGPFVLSEWQPNQQIDLRRNPHYYKTGKPHLDRLVVRIIPEKVNQIQEILGGSIDYVQVVPADQLARLSENSDLEIDAYWGRQFDYVCWNVRHPVFADVRIRRALAMAIDRQAIIDSIYHGYGRVGVTPILSTTWAFDESIDPLPYDPAAARELLTEAGIAPGQLSFELVIQNGVRTYLDASTLIQAHLAKVGVEVVLRPIEFQTWVERVKGHDFEAAIGGWNIPTSLDMSFAFHTEEIGNYNFGSFSNAGLDRTLDEASRESDVGEKRRLLGEVQRILHLEQPYTFLWEIQRLDARSRRVVGAQPNSLTSYFNIDEWRVQEAD